MNDNYFNRIHPPIANYYYIKKTDHNHNVANEQYVFLNIIS